MLVIGAGGVGQFCVQGARIAGAEAIVVVDPLEARLELARELGATHTTDPDGLKALMKEIAPRRRRRRASTSSATRRRPRWRCASPAAAAPA